jgi:nitroreductase/FMN reductase [NAD(P)H]
MPWIATAPLFMVFCGDHRRLKRIFELRQRPFPNDTLDMFMNAAVDTGLALQNFIIAAEALGLGCCPISVVRNHVEKLAALLELPPGVFPVAGLCAGYPSQPGWVSMRLPPSVTVHTDRYDDGDLPARLENYDRRREARHATPRENQRFPERFGHAEPYGWSEDKARQYSVPERHNFGPFVRGHGFSLA